MEFDEEKAIQQIRSRLGSERSERYSDDDLLDVVDIIWDFYEENGLLEIDYDEDMDEEEVLDDLLVYAKRMILKDKDSNIQISDLEDIVLAEIEYENTLDEF